MHSKVPAVYFERRPCSDVRHVRQHLINCRIIIINIIIIIIIT